ncbi:MAG TPA: hypothetical protein HPP97_03735 [Desulfuromonadales bacterium]|nr:hypothetical protein [Desulfuromonadales bacterium]
MEIIHTRNHLTDSDELHRIAEEQMRLHTPDERVVGSGEATERLVHDLEVHQIELEIQNTELRDARYEVEMDLERYTDLYEHGLVGYFNLNRDGTILAVNLAAANLIRIERSLLPGRCFRELLAEEGRTTFTRFLERIFTTRTDETCEAVILDNAGLPLTVEIGAAISSSGQECRLSLLNISRQKETVPQIHEIVHHNGTTLASGNIALELGVCSIREALDAAMAMLREKMQERGVAIHPDLAPEANQRIVADFEMLKQIFFSLLANAIRFSPANGTVDVKSVRDGDLLKITIADMGTGIREEVLPNLFKAFTLLESEYTLKNEGSGLCLPLIRQLVELHGGTIRVESEFGIGSRFSVSIPLRNCIGIT